MVLNPCVIWSLKTLWKVFKSTCQWFVVVSCGNASTLYSYMFCTVIPPFSNWQTKGFIGGSVNPLAKWTENRRVEWFWKVKSNLPAMCSGFMWECINTVQLYVIPPLNNWQDEGIWQVCQPAGKMDWNDWRVNRFICTIYPEKHFVLVIRAKCLTGLTLLLQGSKSVKMLIYFPRSIWCT